MLLQLMMSPPGLPSTANAFKMEAVQSIHAEVLRTQLDLASEPSGNRNNAWAAAFVGGPTNNHWSVKDTEREKTVIARRTILATLMASAAASAFAQNQSGRTRADAGASSADEPYIQQTLAIGALSLTVSRIAQQKIQSPKLKEFSQFEVAEQETVADVLKSLQNPELIKGVVKHPSDFELEQHLDQGGQETVQKMRAAQPGLDFDREYLDAQTKGHLELLRIQEAYLGSAQHERHSANVAKLVRGMIKEHLQLLADIKAGLGSENTMGAAQRR